MILVDTSVWLDHFRRGDAALARELDAGAVLTHPFVIGEIACGTLPRRAETLALLAMLPAATMARHDEVLAYIETHRLAGSGIGFIDMHLLASVALTTGATLWTRDKRLAAVASSLRLAYADGGR